MNIARAVARFVPQPVVSRAGRLQFEHPAFGGILRRVAGWVAKGETVVAHGVGKGLRIDANSLRAGYALGTSDRDEQEWLAATLRPGDTFCDVGGGLGFFTLIGARLVGPTGRVVAFEPHPVSVSQLRKNVGLNYFDNVEVIESAVTATSGTVALSIGDGWHKSRVVANRFNETVDVPAVSLDQYFVGRTPPAVVKIDVEGGEVDVLRGALGILRLGRPRVLVEVHWLGTEFTEFVAMHIVPLGFQFTRLDGSPVTVAIERFHALLTPVATRAPAP